VFKENSLYILSSNQHKLSRLPGRFLEKVRQIRGKGLFHLSDESYSGGYETYSSFDFVLKNHYSALFNNPAIKMLPLGPTKNAMNGFEIRPVSKRRYVWSFAGAATAARLEMLNNFECIGPHQCLLFDSRRQEKPVLDHNAFLALLSDSIFSPCPMGNVMLETFRVYESLEMGCIPIVERRPWMPYYDLLMPDNPLPAFSCWRAACQFVQALSRQESELAEHQRRIADWWQSYKIRIRGDVTSFVSLGLKGSLQSFLAADWHCPGGYRHQIWRLFELLKHANRASLQERVGITLSRIGHRSVR
jgi:hypothetical protein